MKASSGSGEWPIFKVFTVDLNSNLSYIKGFQSAENEISCFQDVNGEGMFFQLLMWENAINEYVCIDEVQISSE